ncbi:universal stress protein [Streptomyces sp. NPDC023998]|uniref:universal stress protein n=1 Tax=Streptomyces sp. NPDC023998 TaxID=3154597 RepID=UPI003405FD49
MELPLVVGVDGSESSLQALDWSVDEAARHGAPLRLVYASKWEHYEGVAHAGKLGRPDEQVFAENVVGSAAERAGRRNPDVKVSAEVLTDDPVTVLLRESRKASAVVTGSRGRGELRGLLLGSVGLAVAARAHCPVIVVRGDKAALGSTHGRILLGVADTAGGRAAVTFALREAEASSCNIDAVRAWRRPAHETTDHPLLAGDPALYYEEQAATLLDEALGKSVRDNPAVQVHRTAVEGQASKVLVQRSAAADLLVVGAQRRQGHFGLQLGRVAHAVLHHADCPVAVVPQPV